MLEARPLTKLELSKNGFSVPLWHVKSPSDLDTPKAFSCQIFESQASTKPGKSGSSKSGNVTLSPQNCTASISFCVARFGNRGRLLQLFQARTICCDLCQAFFQRLFGRGLLLQSAISLERVKLRCSPQSVEQILRLLVLQEFVVRAPCVHCCAVGCDCSRTSSDCSDGTSTKCVNIQKVLNGYEFCSDLQRTNYPPSQKIGMGGLHRFL